MIHPGSRLTLLPPTDSTPHRFTMTMMLTAIVSSFVSFLLCLVACCCRVQVAVATMETITLTITNTDKHVYCLYHVLFILNRRSSKLNKSRRSSIMRVLAFLFTVFVGMLASVVTARSHLPVRLKGGKDGSDEERRHLGAPTKVLICHIPPGNPDNYRTISVGPNAAAAHVAKGSLEGACECSTRICNVRGDCRFIVHCPLARCTATGCTPTSKGGKAGKR
jgi:hypothetical protein